MIASVQMFADLFAVEIGAGMLGDRGKRVARLTDIINEYLVPQYFTINLYTQTSLY